MENDLYTEMAPYYKAIAGDRDHFLTQVRIVNHFLRRFNITKNAKILDAACGVGDVVQLLLNEGYENVIGIDGSISMLKQANFKISERLKLVRWEELNTIFHVEDEFDCIFILGHSLPHTNISTLPQIFNKIFNGLNDNGIFLFDIRDWIFSHNSFRQLSRAESVERFLGEFSINNAAYWIYDQVEYQDNIQVVKYSIYELKNAKICLLNNFSLKYFIYDFDSVKKLLIKSGFAIENIGIVDYPKWPYQVIYCMKSKLL